MTVSPKSVVIVVLTDTNAHTHTHTFVDLFYGSVWDRGSGVD